MKKFLRDNGLSLVLLVLFLAFWAGQALAGHKVQREDQLRHHQPVESFKEYLMSGHFWQATGENWESEFLQMGAYVLLTKFLYQRGSAESLDPDDPEAGSPSPAEKGQKNAWMPHSKMGLFFYKNSLCLGFLALFAASFAIHAMGGLAEFNAEHAEHGEPAASLGDYLRSSEFWFQSYQNWQSEFLAVLSIVTLSIFLRQDGSPQSKKITDPNSKTGD